MSQKEQTAALEDWLRQQPGGYLHPSLHITADGETHDVHWSTTTTIESGVRLITVPHSLSLSYLNALVDDEYEVLRRRRGDLAIENIGFFYLMLQYINKDRSFWKPYLDLLPSPEDEIATPLYFDSEEDLIWLQGTDVLYTMQRRKAIYERYHTNGVAILQQAGIETSSLTWNLFRWAVTMFTSRSFSSRAIAPLDRKYWTAYKTGPDGRRQSVLLDMSHVPSEDLDFSVLFPAMDASNHDHNARVQWYFDPGRFGLSTAGPVQGGTEVNNNYGPKGNDELLMGYGFCIAGNPFDTVMLTLKPPPEGLQEVLKMTHSGYFTSSGTWNGDKATFRLGRLQNAKPNVTADEIFNHLPEPLLELLTHIVRYDRGLPFQEIPEVLSYLGDRSSHGRRYLPFIARMIVQSLAPKLANIQAPSRIIALGPQSQKQLQAAVYRNGQMEILATTMASLREFLRSLRPSLNGMPIDGVLLTLEEAICYFKAHTEFIPSFLEGLEVVSNSDDISVLITAGWEEDIWVLLLCYAWISLSTVLGQDEPRKWIRQLGEEYSASVDDSYPISSDTDLDEQSKNIENVVRAAANALPNSAWNDTKWTKRLIAGFGGRVLKNQGFMMMVPNADSVESPRLVLYMHA